MDHSRWKAIVLAAALGAGAAAAAALVAACLSAAPPDLPTIPTHPPAILHDSVVPPPDSILAGWPLEFTVPVRLDDPTQSFAYNVFVDYDRTAGPAGTSPSISEHVPGPASTDSGVTIVNFNLNPPDPRFCHRIEFIVAVAFDVNSAHTPDSNGGDSVTWLYNAGGGPNGCPLYDAGEFQDGAFAPADAPSEGLLVVPDSGGDR